MKVAFLLLVCLPFLFADTVSDHAAALENYNLMTPEEKRNLHQTANNIKQWFHDHGMQLTASACGVFCATEAAVTLGIGAPVCAAACALIGLIG